MLAFGIVLLILALISLSVGIGSIVYWNLRAKRLGLPPPPWQTYVPFMRAPYSAAGGTPQRAPPTGLGGWIIHLYRRARGGRNSRTATGAYEGGGPSTTRAARQGFGPLDPDDAWDTRVGAEADAYYYNEEQELGLHPGGRNANANASQLNAGAPGGGSSTAYLGSAGVAAAGSTYDMNVPAAAAAAADDDQRGRTRGGGGALNPFDEDAEPSNLSLRGVSPRPMADPTPGRGV